MLALLAQGATNRQIGAALFMAEKTASVHVSRILGKLDVRSRTQGGRGRAHRPAPHVTGMDPGGRRSRVSRLGCAGSAPVAAPARIPPETAGSAPGTGARAYPLDAGLGAGAPARARILWRSMGPRPSVTARSRETLAGLLDGGDATAMVCAEDGGRTTYERLADEVDGVARRLSALGVGRGDRVALVIPDGAALVPLLFGVTAVGAAAAPLNPAYTRSEFAFYLEDLAPARAGPSRGRDRARPRGRRGGAARPRGARRDGSTGRARRPLRAGARGRRRALLHTSGTTSRPKQVPLRHRNLMASARAIAAFYELTDADTSYCMMPLFHVHGLVASTFAAMAAGGVVVVPRRLSRGACGGSWTSSA